MNKDNDYYLVTPEEEAAALAGRLKALRLSLGFKQATLAEHAGVSLPSLRRFEQTGKVSLNNFLKLCFVLGRLSEMDTLLKPPPAESLAELEAREQRPRRKRGIK